MFSDRHRLRYPLGELWLAEAGFCTAVSYALGC